MQLKSVIAENKILFHTKLDTCNIFPSYLLEKKKSFSSLLLFFCIVV